MDQRMLYWTTLNTTDAVQNLRINKNGRIKAIEFDQFTMSGAGTDARGCIQLAINTNTRQFVNDAPPTVLANFAWAAPVNAGASVNRGQILCDFPVRQGDIIYAHQYETGTVLASRAAHVIMHIA